MKHVITLLVAMAFCNWSNAQNIPSWCPNDPNVNSPVNHNAGQSELELHPGGSTQYNLTGLAPDGSPYVFLHHEAGSSCFNMNNVNRLGSFFDDCQDQSKLDYPVCSPFVSQSITQNDKHAYRCNREINGDDHHSVAFSSGASPAGWYRGAAPAAHGIVDMAGLQMSEFQGYLAANPGLVLTYNSTAGTPGDYVEHHNVDPTYLFFAATCNQAESGPGGFGSIQNCGVNSNGEPNLNANKNTFVIGTKNLQSLWGPQIGGLLKPDFVSSPYFSSFSTPRASGVALLLREQWHKKSPSPTTPLSSTIKAIMAHTTDGVPTGGSSNGVIQTFPIPSYQKGWGMVNGVKAATLIDKNFTGVDEALIVELSFTNGAVNESQTQVYSDGSTPLKATIAWHEILLAGSGFNLHDSHIVENDFNLTITNETTGQVVFPLVLDPNNPAASPVSSPGLEDNINNIEQVLIENPTAGFYTIKVSGPSSLFQGTDQIVSLVVDGTSTAPPNCGTLSLSTFDTDNGNYYSSSDWFSGNNNWRSRWNSSNQAWRLYQAGSVALSQGILGEATDVNVSFDYMARNVNPSSTGWSGGQTFELQVSDGPGLPYTTVQSWTEGVDFTPLAIGQAASWNSLNACLDFDLTSPNSTFRFENKSTGLGSLIYLDNIQIEACTDCSSSNLVCTDLTYEDLEGNPGFWSQGNNFYSNNFGAHASSGTGAALIMQALGLADISSGGQDFTNYDEAELEFSFTLSGNVTAGDQLLMEIRNGSDPWETFNAVDLTAFASQPAFTHNVVSATTSSSLGGNTQFQIRIVGPTANLIAIVDDLTISGCVQNTGPTLPPGCYNPDQVLTTIDPCDFSPDPVCGCDGVSYYNSTQAWFNGITSYSTGPCPGVAVLDCDADIDISGKGEEEKIQNDVELSTSYGSNNLLRFTIENLTDTNHVEYEIYSLQGQRVYEGTSGYNSWEFDASSLPKGMYVVRTNYGSDKFMVR